MNWTCGEAHVTFIMKNVAFLMGNWVAKELSSKLPRDGLPIASWPRAQHFLLFDALHLLNFAFKFIQ